VFVISNQGSLESVLFDTERTNKTELGTFVDGKDIEHVAILKEACKQLNEYFDGTRTEFDLVTFPQGNPWQKKVWNEVSIQSF